MLKDDKALVNFHGDVKGDVNIHYIDEDHHYYTDEDGQDDDDYFSELDGGSLGGGTIIDDGNDGGLTLDGGDEPGDIEDPLDEDEPGDIEDPPDDVGTIVDDDGSDHCDYNADNPQSSAVRDLAAYLDWDMLGFITDWTAGNPQMVPPDSSGLPMPQIDEQFMLYVYKTVCCRDLNESIDAMLTSYGFYDYELEDHQTAVLSPLVKQGQDDALARCTAAGHDWTDHDNASRAAQQLAPHGDECDHWAYAWHHQKSVEQELAEELNWDVTGFLTDHYDPDQIVDVDPRIDDNFIVYVYNTACCDQLQEVRDLMLESSGLTYFQLRTSEDILYSQQVFDASEAAFQRCGIPT